MWTQSYRKNKYNNVSCRYNDYIYDSKKEVDYAKELDMRLRAKDIKGWDRQFKVSIDINGFHICNYFVDFRIFENDGSFTLIEIKGMETMIWRLKRKLLEAVWLPEHPDYIYQVIK
jgi:hypothetical protein